jgi:hypothetical protein
MTLDCKQQAKEQITGTTMGKQARDMEVQCLACIVSTIVHVCAGESGVYTAKTQAARGLTYDTIRCHCGCCATSRHPEHTRAAAFMMKTVLAWRRDDDDDDDDDGGGARIPKQGTTRMRNTYRILFTIVQLRVPVNKAAVQVRLQKKSNRVQGAVHDVSNASCYRCRD